MASEKQNIKRQEYDPDEFVLSKKDVEEFIDIIIHYWGRTFKDKVKNIKRIGSFEAFKAGLIFTDDDDFKLIWSMTLYFINQLQYENAVAKMSTEGGKTKIYADSVKKLKSDLRHGGLEKLFARFNK